MSRGKLGRSLGLGSEQTASEPSFNPLSRHLWSFAGLYALASETRAVGVNLPCLAVVELLLT
jgi:hypothetical protein